MIYRKICLPFCLLLVCGLGTATHPPLATPSLDIRSFTIQFFEDQIQVDYAANMLIEEPAKLDNSSIDRVYHQLASLPLEVLLNSLLARKAEYQLNDFLFYKLVRNSLAAIYGGKSYRAREISLFVLLAKAGYDVRLTYRNNRAYVNVHTNDELFEVPIIDYNGRTYANISCLNGECSGRQSLYIYRRHPNPQGKAFGFKLEQWPTLSAQPIARPLEFNYHGAKQQLEIEFDQTMVDIMADYPFIHEYCYLETPLSPTLSASLLPSLRKLIAPLSEQEQLELLASFTRSAFVYKEDHEFFGRSKPMVPEEVFSYAFSDCEDRSALFFALVRDLLDTPMAVVAYEDHLTVAVASDHIPGDSFSYNGRRYVFCDPTGPSGSSRIGEIPPGYEDEAFQIIGQYR